MQNTLFGIGQSKVGFLLIHCRGQRSLTTKDSEYFAKGKICWKLKFFLDLEDAVGGRGLLYGAGGVANAHRFSTFYPHWGAVLGDYRPGVFIFGRFLTSLSRRKLNQNQKRDSITIIEKFAYKIRKWHTSGSRKHFAPQSNHSWRNTGNTDGTRQHYKDGCTRQTDIHILIALIRIPVTHLDGRHTQTHTSTKEKTAHK